MILKDFLLYTSLIFFAVAAATPKNFKSSKTKTHFNLIQTQFPRTTFKNINFPQNQMT